VLDRGTPSPYNSAALQGARDVPRAAQVAQLVEHVTENHGVGGSIPPLGTIPARRQSGGLTSTGIPSGSEGSRGKPATIFDLPTPALLLDRPRLRRNAERMRDKVRMLGVILRPHVKTAKSIDVHRVISADADMPITVSTIAEARYFFAHGVTDILYAVGIAPVKLPEVAELIRAGCKLRIILDTVEAAAAVRGFAEAEGVNIEALIEIDSDGHRAGVAPDDPLLIEIGRALGPGLAGVM